jgi:hypothetical protein
MLKKLSDYKFIDIHYHASPDLYHRRWNAIKAGQHYAKLNGAVVLKSHLGSTAIQATLAQQAGYPVFASLVLNTIAGGLDYQVIIRALCEYQPVISANLLVHFPTITGRKHSSKLNRQLTQANLQSYVLKGLYITKEGSQFELKKEVIDIIKMAKDHPIVLSSGHANKEEVYALVDACDKHQVKLLLNQPANPLTGLNAEELLKITHCPWIWVEQTFLTYSLAYQDENDFTDVIQKVPRVIYSSDLGQTDQTDISEWREYSERKFEKLKLSDKKKENLWKTHALKLLTQ